jgi:hypothetical protein
MRTAEMVVIPRSASNEAIQSLQGDTWIASLALAMTERAVPRRLLPITRVARSRRQRLAGLLPHDVVGVPVRPVRIWAAGPFLMLAMRRRCAPERAGEVMG